MRRRPAAVFGVLLLASGVFAVSCSDDNDDPVGRACRLIVQGCHAMKDMSECIDLVGDLDGDCVLCIGDTNDCSYFSTCQRSLVTCNLPSDIAPPGSQTNTDAGVRQPDAGIVHGDGGS